MKKNLFFLTCLFAMLTTLSFGQSYTFKVMANKGANEVKDGGTWKPLRSGTLLNENDEIKVSANAYIGLVHSSGRTMELNTAGNFKVKELASKVSTGSSSVASKYADFVLSKMEDDEPRSRLNATGAVHRAAMGGSKLQVFLPRQGNEERILPEAFTNQTVIRWQDMGAGKVYVVTISDMMDEVILKKETTETSLTIDYTDASFKEGEGGAVQVLVALKEDPTINSGFEMDGYIIRLPKKEVKEKVQQEIKSIVPDFDANSALHHFIVAGYFESNKQLVDALTYYEKAVALAPDVEFYQEAYKDFLNWAGYTGEVGKKKGK
jgi:hypothetical protein